MASKTDIKYGFLGRTLCHLLLALVRFLGRKKRRELSLRMRAALQAEDWGCLKTTAETAIMEAEDQENSCFLVEALIYLETVIIQEAAERNPGAVDTIELAHQQLLAALS